MAASSSVRGGRTRCGAIRQQVLSRPSQGTLKFPTLSPGRFAAACQFQKSANRGPLSDPALQATAKGWSRLSAASLGVEKAVMREIKESDWKILRQLHSQALERFCKQILLEIERINCDNAKTFHRKYLDIYEVLQRRDKEIAQTFDGLRRSTAFTQVASMKARGLLTEDEFLRFSQETRNVVDLLLGG
jgi:hypothetical protein